MPQRDRRAATLCEIRTDFSSMNPQAECPRPGLGHSIPARSPHRSAEIPRQRGVVAMSKGAASRQLIERLQKADRLPSPSGVALRIVELCRRENSTARELTDVLSTDATLTAR